MNLTVFGLLAAYGIDYGDFGFYDHSDIVTKMVWSQDHIMVPYPIVILSAPTVFLKFTLFYPDVYFFTGIVKAPTPLVNLPPLVLNL